ncbi:GntR family transcriptional regulator [Streptomyces sp. NPDC002537]
MSIHTQYQRIAADLRNRIESGELEMGTQLPAETALATQYRVGAPTVRRALELLQAEGMVDKFHGRGNFVRWRGPRIAYVGDRHTTSEQACVEVTLEVSVDTRKVEASAALSETLHTPTGAPLTEYVYLSRKEDSPQTLARVYVPCGVAVLPAPTAAVSPWGDDVRVMLSHAGVYVEATTERIIARVPTAEEAQLLQIPLNAPVVAMERTSFDAYGRVVEGAFLVLPGDSTEAIYTHTADTPLQRLPWDKPDGTPSFLGTLDPGSVAKFADEMEKSQMQIGASVLRGCEAVLDDTKADVSELRYALKQALGSLHEVLRVADCRGSRLPTRARATWPREADQGRPAQPLE